MKLSIASGKGGTGKTTVSASLLSVWPDPVVAVDLDVEEPNLHLFLNPAISGTRKAYMEIPKVDESLCSLCGQCSALCQFKAISLMGEILMTFPEMCHGCGGCIAICPEKELSVDLRELGDISWGRWAKGDFIMGQLRVGEAMSPPLMRAVKTRLEDLITASPADVIIDSPPGVSCPAVNSVMDADMIVLVTEPTPFGVYDMKLAHQAFAPMKKPMGVVVNRAGLGNSEIYNYCAVQNLEILAEIPYDRRIAEAYSNGCVIADTSEEMRQLFTVLSKKIKERAVGGGEGAK
jgi:MinD superfamily P-loop ATPase